MKSVFAFIFFLMLFSNSYSQNCGGYNVKSKGGNDGYQFRSGDERCEGLITENVSGLTLDVISFTYGQLLYKLYNDDTITIKSSTLKDYKSIYIRGANYGMYDSYRLDMSLGSDSSKRIPVSTVLVPNKISDKNLGIYGYISIINSDKFYIPAYVYSKSYRYKILDSKNFYLKLISNTTITDLKWRYADYKHNQCGDYSDFNFIEGAYTHLNPVSIILPGELSAKQICLDVHYKTSAGDSDSKFFYLIIP